MELFAVLTRLHYEILGRSALAELRQMLDIVEKNSLTQGP